MFPYPHHFVTSNNIDIDLRLHNNDLQTKIGTIISSLLAESIPKNWFNITKRRLINEYKLDRQMELGLSKQGIVKRVQSQLNTEYTERIFEAIKNSIELEHLTPGLGCLLVAQARSILIMKSVVDKLTDDFDEHMKIVNKIRNIFLKFKNFFRHEKNFFVNIQSNPRSLVG
jgi:ribosomal protein S17E